jgi:3',5'-cyclic-AMP phosphodiesterase
MGRLGAEQLDWLTTDLGGLAASTPVVVFAHVPLWTVHEKWGWGTQDAAQALALLKRFGSVTVLNGHIHQVMQKVEGQVAFHTARSTAFPQNVPGVGTPGPVRDLPAGKLRGVLGLTTVKYVERGGPLAIADPTLE